MPVVVFAGVANGSASFKSLPVNCMKIRPRKHVTDMKMCVSVFLEEGCRVQGLGVQRSVFLWEVWSGW